MIISNHALDFGVVTEVIQINHYDDAYNTIMAKYPQAVEIESMGWNPEYHGWEYRITL